VTSEQSGKCPKCGKPYTNKIRAPTTAGEYDLFDGALKPPPCKACAERDDKRSRLWEREFILKNRHKEIKE
jgi:hypothetical protein